jgi:hypothetical protein
MSDLDLNIDNYSIIDLELFFKLNPNQTYTASDIELQETIISSQLLSSGHINMRIKNDLMGFLNTAKNLLITTKCPPLYKPTTLPKNTRLDPYNLPLSQEAPCSRIGEIITRPETQYIYTQNSDYFPGISNPLKLRTITKCLNIDSLFRTTSKTYTPSSDFTFQLPLTLNKVVSMQLTAFEIPKTFYGISAALGNNYLNMSLSNQQADYNYDSVYNNFIVIIPDGNYSNQSLLDEINLQLCPRNTDGTINPANNFNNFFAFIHFRLNNSDNITNQVIFEISPEGLEYLKIIPVNGTLTPFVIDYFNMDFTLDITGVVNTTLPLYCKLGFNLGFVKNYIYQDAKFYISESSINTNLNNYIYLAIDDFNNSVNNTFISAFNESLLSPDILARITINKDTDLVQTKIMNLDNSFAVNEMRQYFGPVDIQKIRVRLFNCYGNILELNNVEYSLCLSFKMLYDL